MLTSSQNLGSGWNGAQGLNLTFVGNETEQLDKIYETVALEMLGHQAGRIARCSLTVTLSGQPRAQL